MSPPRTLGLVFLGVLALGCTRDERGVGDRLSEARAEDGRFISWVEHRIDDSALAGIRLRGADGLTIGDLDGDGFYDLVAVHEDSDHLRLSFGTGDPDDWRSITLAEGALVAEVEDSALADLDADGDLDLVVACEDAHLAYFENPGGAPARIASAWRSVIPSATRGRGSWIRVYAANLDGDSSLEVVATNKSIPMPSGKGSMDVPSTPVSIFEIDGDPLDPDAWRETPLAEYVVPVNARPVDLDADGDLDVLAGSRGESRMIVHESREDGWVAWPIAPANPQPIRWLGLPKGLSGFELAFADLNADGRLDIVVNDTVWSIAWLEQPERFDAPWTAHRIGWALPDSPNALALVDVDGDGRLDLFSGGYSEDPRETETPDPGLLHRGGGIWWFEQPADATEAWTRHDVSRRVRGMYDVFVPRDLDGDGLVDFLGTRGNSGDLDGVFWLRQRRTEAPAPVFQSAWKTDSRQLPPFAR